MAVFLVNPDNKEPNDDEVFPDSVAQRVPYTLRILCLCYSVLIASAVVLIFAGPLPETEPETDADT